MIRGLECSGELHALLKEITAVLFDAGWLDGNCAPMDRIANDTAACADSDKSYKITSDKIFNLQRFHELPHHRVIQHIMRHVAGPDLLIHPKSAARLIFPNLESGIIHAHQDHTSVGGDEESFTAWMPLHDCSLEDGPLRILEGSHKLGLQPTGESGYLPPGNECGCEWVGGELNAGDLLIFHSLTVHEALPNRSRRLRISLDCRFQSYGRPVNPATLVFTGSGRRTWEDVYSNWTSNKLQYYWASLPLKLSPSKQELAELAHTAENEKMRARYARILDRIEQQLPTAS